MSKGLRALKIKNWSLDSFKTCGHVQKNICSYLVSVQQKRGGGSASKFLSHYNGRNQKWANV